MTRLGSFLLAALALPAPIGRAAPVSPSAATGTIVGTVRDERAGPLSGAVVAVTGTPLQVLTGASGEYRIDRVPAGTLELTARAMGRRAATSTARLQAGATLRVDFTLSAAATLSQEMGWAGKAMLNRAASPSFAPSRGQFNTEEYRRFYDNTWLAPSRRPLSTFSIDVDAASYTNIRRFILQGALPPRDAVRVEEMINYFPYAYPEPAGPDPFTVTTELGPAPWRPRHRLALIGLQARRLPVGALPPANLVFLLDVSGSMDSPDKLPLVKSAFRLLVNQLRPVDRVAIVVYAGAAGVVLPSTPGDQKDLILDALEQLQAGGSTAGAQGIRLAYETARRNLVAEGTNRVILATDGDFNVGVSSEGELIRLIEGEREHGVFLTVLGFGTGNLKDAKMEQLADKGNGHYAYVNDIMEARKVFVQEIGATLLTVAKDVKIQVEFNPARVQAYRLIGYEKRLLADEDFNDDSRDAGELGAGHSVTALYEIVPVGIPLDVTVGSTDPLKYQVPDRGTGTGSGEWMTVKLRYKLPTGTASRLLTRTIEGEGREPPSETFRFASAVAGVGMLLRGSDQAGSATYASLAAQARESRGSDRDGYRAEFVKLANLVTLLSNRAETPRLPQ